MKKILLKTGVTLIELIVSLSLVSIVLLGIFAVNSVLKNNNEDYGQRYLVKSETQETLSNILAASSLAVGDATGSHPAFLIGAGGAPNGVGNADTFCIHQSPTGGDVWICYTWTPANYQINYCAFTYQQAIGYPYGAAACSVAPPAPAILTSGPTFVGTAFNNPTPAAIPSNQSLFTITLTNCLNDANPPGTCSASGTSNDLVNNPEVQINGSVIASQVSTG